MTEARPFETIVGETVRARRKELGQSQDEVARRAATYGFTATRGVVDAIERGTKKLDLLELSAILGALGLTLPDLQGQVSLDAAHAELGELVDYAIGGRRTVTVYRDGVSFVVSRSGAVGTFGGDAALRSFVGAYSDAEVKAARKLNTDPKAVCEASERVWGRRLVEERDSRVFAQAANDATHRTLQALRGHVSRALLEELRATLSPPRPSRSSKAKRHTEGAPQ